ncbi:MAG: hypothetical protein ACRD96_13795 [Bryobacteraceae bacterium]
MSSTLPRPVTLFLCVVGRFPAALGQDRFHQRSLHAEGLPGDLLGLTDGLLPSQDHNTSVLDKQQHLATPGHPGRLAHPGWNLNSPLIIYL